MNQILKEDETFSVQRPERNRVQKVRTYGQSMQKEHINRGDVKHGQGFRANDQ